MPGIGAGKRRRALRRRRDVPERGGPRLAGQTDLQTGMSQLGEDITESQVRVVQKVIGAIHRAGRYPRRLQPGGHLGRCSAARPRRQGGGQSGLIRGRFGFTDHPARRLPHGRGGQRDHTPLVLARARQQVMRCSVVADYAGRPGGQRDVADVELIDSGLCLGDVHFRAHTTAHPPDHRSQGADRRDPADDVIGEDRGRVVERVATRIGTGIGRSRRRPQAGHAGGGTDQRPVAHLGSPGAAVPESAALGENKPWVELA